MRKEVLFNGRNAAILGALVLSLFFVMNGSWVGAGAVAKAAPGAAIPDMRFAYAPSDLGPEFAALGPAGRAAYLRMNAWDFVFAACYGALFLLLFQWMVRRLVGPSSPLRFFGLLGLLAGICDETENIVFRIFASTGAAPGPAALIASIATPIKFLGFYLSVPFLAAGVLAVVFKALATRASKAG